MSTLVITPTTPNWRDEIEAHLRSGETAVVQFERPFMTPDQMARSIGISRQAILRRIHKGEIASERHGNRHRIPLPEVERFRQWYIQDVAAAAADDF